LSTTAPSLGPAPASLLLPKSRLRKRRAARIVWTGVRHSAVFGGRVLRRPRDGVAAAGASEMRRAFENLGPTFVKFGQVIASSPAFPDSLVQEFERCLDQVRPEPIEAVRRTIEESIGDVEAHYARVDWTPVAAGSIAQVFRAWGHDGEALVIKVQRRNLPEVLRNDVRMLHLGARAISRVAPSLRSINPVGVVEDFAATLAQELSFVEEARQMEVLGASLQGWPVRVPEVRWDRTTDQVLTMTHLEGVKISDLDGLDRYGVDRAKLVDVVFGLLLYTACRHGMFHGDMHAGNIIVQPDGKVALIDFGIVGRLPGQLRLQVSELLQCLFEERWDRLAPLCFEMAEMDDVDMEGAIDDLTQVAEKYLAMPLHEMPLAEMVGDILQRCNKYGFVMPSDVILFFKSLMYLDGLGIRIHPGYEVLNPEHGLALRPFLAPETGGSPEGVEPTYGYENVLQLVDN
jgi:ubiquinone biosynthesis protein